MKNAHGQAHARRLFPYMGKDLALWIALLILALAVLPWMTSCTAFGQTLPLPVPATATSKEVVAFVGTSYNSTGSPKSTLTLGGMYPIGDSGAQYVGVVADLAFTKNSQPGITIRPEFLHSIATINGHAIYGIAGIGASFIASDPVAVIRQVLPTLRAAVDNVGTNVGYNAATGVITDIHLFRGLYLFPSFRVVKGSLSDTQYVVGVNIGGKIRVAGKQ